jgi:signal transduction histidine kinase
MDEHSLRDEIARWAAQHPHPADLEACAKSLRKLSAGEGSDWEALAQLRAQQQQLRQELDKCYEIISFQLGSPLNTLQALSDMLMKSASGMSKDQVLEFNEHLHAQIGKVQTLLGNLILWADLSVKNFRCQPAPLAAAALAESVFEQYESQAMQKRQDYQLALSGELPVQADAAMLRRILGNLLSNAIKFTPAEGRIRLSGQRQGDWVRFEVSDSGVGLSEAKIRNLFNPGRKSTQRGTANEAGLGMGLIVAKALVELHGAALELESQPQQGTRFWFALPAAAL